MRKTTCPRHHMEPSPFAPHILFCPACKATAPAPVLAPWISEHDAAALASQQPEAWPPPPPPAKPKRTRRPRAATVAEAAPAAPAASESYDYDGTRGYATWHSLAPHDFQTCTRCDGTGLGKRIRLDIDRGRCPRCQGARQIARYDTSSNIRLPLEIEPVQRPA